MHDFPDEAFPAASAFAACPPDENVPEIRARATDAILGVKKAEEDPARSVPPLFERLLSYGPRAALAACLFGFAWVAGSIVFFVVFRCSVAVLRLEAAARPNRRAARKHGAHRDAPDSAENSR